MVKHLKPPEGYDSWLDYAIATMDTRTLYNISIDSDFANWGREITREEMVEAAKEELRNLRNKKR